MALDDFHRREEERRMKEAALRLDYEQAIIHRDKFRELEKKRLETLAAEPVRPKIVNIFSKDAHTVCETDTTVRTDKSEEDDAEDGEVKNEAPDEDVIAMLNSVMEMANSGHVRALGLLVGTGYGDHVREVDGMFTDGVLDNVRMFVGGAYTFANDILGVEADMLDYEIDSDGDSE